MSTPVSLILPISHSMRAAFIPLKTMLDDINDAADPRCASDG
jgi:hypothetical protein